MTLSSHIRKKRHWTDFKPVQSKWNRFWFCRDSYLAKTRYHYKPLKKSSMGERQSGEKKTCCQQICNLRSPFWSPTTWLRPVPMHFWHYPWVNVRVCYERQKPWCRQVSNLRCPWETDFDSIVKFHDAIWPGYFLEKNVELSAMDSIIYKHISALYCEGHVQPKDWF
jgi:hypothetical protein